MSKVLREKIGCWSVSTHVMSRHSKAEQVCFDWVVNNADLFKETQLDIMISELKSVLFCEYANGIKDTVSLKKVAGGTYANGAVDHYKLVIKNNRGASWTMLVSEPIGTDLNRHKSTKTITL